LSTANEWKGYVEDRRPASNGDPYKIVKVISEGLDFAQHLDRINHTMTTKVDVEKAKEALAYLGVNFSEGQYDYEEEERTIDNIGRE
jgi:hypothetical protein